MLFVVGFALAGCGGDAAEQRALVELERMAFLPVIEFPPRPGQTPAGARVPEALLVDRYEVTRGEWRSFIADSPGPIARPLAGWMRDWEPESDRWPATFMTQGEAARFAAWRGMRLLTASEWYHCEMGPSLWLYPWGMTWQDSVANTLELRLGRPTPVGTFETGRSWIGCYDILGNVAEWVSDHAHPSLTLPGDGRVSAMGGSFRTRVRSAAGRSSRSLDDPMDPNSRSDDLGLRCAVEAASYLWDHAAEWGEGEEVRARLVAVGRAWGRRSLPLLQDLAARSGAPAGLRALMEGARE